MLTIPALPAPRQHNEALRGVKHSDWSSGPPCPRPSHPGFAPFRSHSNYVRYFRGTGPVSHAPGKMSAPSECSMNRPPMASYAFRIAIIGLPSPWQTADCRRSPWRRAQRTGGGVFFIISWRKVSSPLTWSSWSCVRTTSCTSRAYNFQVAAFCNTVSGMRSRVHEDPMTIGFELTRGETPPPKPVGSPTSIVESSVTLRHGSVFLAHSMLGRKVRSI